MQAPPSIKGMILRQVVEEVSRLLAAGAVPRDGLGRWLRPEDLAHLSERPLASAWYPIELYTRLNLLLRDVGGDRRDEYLRELGGRTAEMLLASGRYQQIGYARRTALQDATTPEGRFEAFRHDLRLFASMSASVLNFSRWTPRDDPEHARRYLLEVTEASAFPEVLCWRTDGFVNALAAAHGHPGLWRWDRPAPDTVVFRMTREL
jgi:hypothetical protein